MLLNSVAKERTIRHVSFRNNKIDGTNELVNALNTNSLSFAVMDILNLENNPIKKIEEIKFLRYLVFFCKNHRKSNQIICIFYPASM